MRGFINLVNIVRTKETQIFTSKKGVYRYGKGETENESCGVGLEIEVSVCTHGFQYERDIEI